MFLNIIVVSRVDYVDSLGRSRRCLQKDLKHLQEMDKDISNQQRSVLSVLLSLNLSSVLRQLMYIVCTCISVVKGCSARLGVTTYIDLFEVVH